MARELGSWAAFAKKMGVRPGSLYHYVEGSEPTRPTILCMAEAAGVSPAWLLTGEGAKEPGAPPSGYVGVPFYDLRRSAGRVQPLISEAVSEFLLLKAAWLGVEAGAHLFAIEALESFGARVKAGDILVAEAPAIGLHLIYAFDQAHESPSFDGRSVCLIAHRGEALLGRLSWRDRRGRHCLVIAGPDAGSKEIEAELGSPEFFDFQLLGRVIWRGGRP